MPTKHTPKYLVLLVSERSSPSSCQTPCCDHSWWSVLMNLCEFPELCSLKLQESCFIPSWDSGRQSPLSFLSSITTSPVWLQPCSRLFAGACPYSLTPVPEDLTRPWCGLSFPSGCGPSQHLRLVHPHSSMSAPIPRNILYQRPPVATHSMDTGRRITLSFLSSFMISPLSPSALYIKK